MAAHLSLLDVVARTLPPEPWAERQRLRSRCRFEDIVQRSLHRLQHERLENRNRLGWGRNRDVAGVGTKGSAGGESGRVLGSVVLKLLLIMQAHDV